MADKKHPQALTPDRAKNILELNVLNISKKVRDGKTLSAMEKAMLEDATENSGPQDKIVKTQREVAAIFNVDTRTVQRWKARGMPVMRNKKYSIADITEWKKINIDKAKSKEDDHDWEIEYRKFKALREEIRYHVDKSEFIPRDEVISGWIERINIVKSGLMQLPFKLAPLMANESDPRECRVIIESHVRELCNDFADGGAKYMKQDKVE